MSNQEQHQLLEEARLLLPWYLTNKLTTAEHVLVTQALALYPELRKEQRQEGKMMQLVKDNTSLLELNVMDATSQRLAKLMERIESESESKSESVPESPQTPVRPKSRWRDFFQGGTLFDLEWLTPASAVFASLLVLQAGFIAYLTLGANREAGNGGAGNAVYEVASVSPSNGLDAPQTGEEARFLMEFAQDAPHKDIVDFLNALNAHIIAGPNAQNIFTVSMLVAPNVDKAALAESIMQKTAGKNSPVLFVGSQYQSSETLQ